MHKVVAVQARPGYHVWLRFDDGVEGEIDLSALVGKGVFAPWVDAQEFGRVFVDPATHTLAWPGGIDLCPDTLFEDLVAVRSPLQDHSL